MASLAPVVGKPTAAAPDEVGASLGGPGVSDQLQGGVAWYGVFDFATIAAQARAQGQATHDGPQAAEWRMLGGDQATSQQNGKLAAASPVAYVTHATPPLLLLAGDADRTVPHAQTLEMAARLQAAGVPHELHIFPGIDHSFIGPTPAQTRATTLQALDLTFRFFDKYLKAPAATTPTQ